MEPRDFARVILRRKRTVITATIIVVVTALLGSYRKTPVYLATCEVLAQAVGNDPTNPNSRSIEFGSPETYAQLITGPDVAARAAEIMKVPVSRVAGKINVEILQQTQIYRLKTFDGDRKVAGDMCNARAQAFIELRRDNAKTFYKEQLDRIEVAQENTLEELNKIKHQLAGARASGDEGELRRLGIERDNLSLDYSELTKRRTQISSLLKFGIEGGGKVTSPSAGGVRDGGNHRRDGMLGLLVGLMFGIGIALVREYLDDTVKDKESTQRELGLTVLAAMPDEGLDGYVEPSSATVEAARQLRATLGSLGFPNEKQMLLVTSSLAKSRSTTLAALAAAVAESGRSVLVIGSDLRGARTHESFGVANTVGLANVIRGRVSMERAIRPAPGLDGVYVLPCGPIIGNPGELLSSEEMAFLLRRARRWADVVLLDAPPVLAAADASVLGAYADGVLLVVSAGQTNRSQAIEAKEQLVAAGARVLGAVLVGGDEATQHAGADFYGADLPQLVPFGGGYDAGYEGDDGSWDEGALTTTARMAPRASTRRRAPSKKTAASRPGQRPASRRAPEATPSPKRAAGRSGSRSRSVAPLRRVVRTTVARPARPAPTKATRRTQDPKRRSR